MNATEPADDFATVESVSPATALRSADNRDVFHRTCPAPGSRRGIITQQSDAVVLSQSAPIRPPMNRGQSQIQSAIEGSARFVGIMNETTASSDRSDWDSRNLRFLQKRYKLKSNLVNQTDSGNVSSPSAAEMPSTDGHQITTGPASYMAARSPSQDSRMRLEKKDSVVKVVYDAMSSLVKRGTLNRPKPRHAPLTARSSFDVESWDPAEMPSVVSSPTFNVIAEELSTELADAEVPQPPEPGPPEPPVIVEDGEFVELGELERPVSLSSSSRPLRKYSHRRRFMGPTMYDENGVPIPPPRHCFAQIGKARSGILLDQFSDDSLKDVSLRRSVSARSARARPAPPDASSRSAGNEPLLEPEPSSSQYKTIVTVPSVVGVGKGDLGDATIHGGPKMSMLGPVALQVDENREPDRVTPQRKLTKQKSIDEPEPEPLGLHAQMDKIWDTIKLEVVPRRKKRVRGVGPFARLFNHHLGRSEVGKLPASLKDKMEEGEDERPFFTYWVTSVQIIVFILSIISYGVGPFGWERAETSGEVEDTSLALRHVSYFQPAHIWLGPSFADLVRLGAKYSPCMRRERRVWNEIEMERRKENETACCIFNDRAGCYQSGESGCPRNLATWMKWAPKRRGLQRTQSDSTLLKTFTEAGESPGFHKFPHSRSAGAVCGQDPDFCMVPRSAKPWEWPDDLTKWPICKQTRQEGALPQHMTCQITGRPCCIQMQGQCRITTEQYCNFVQGYWHENATLCSQVDCFSDICGMLPFFTKDNPNQAYRLFTSLFIHAGFFHLALTVFVQRWLMVDLENLIGWKRMALVYIGSGIGGNLASAIFVPFNPEVGPSGSQLGIMAALIVDVIHHRQYIDNWKKALLEHLGIVLGLFICGLVPFVDNWAHLFGFTFGFLITMSVFPYLDFNSRLDSSAHSSKSRKLRFFPGTVFPLRRCIFVITSSVACVLLFAVLAYIYFSNIEVDCPFCSYFNCINFAFSDHFCDNNGLELTHMLPI